MSCRRWRLWCLWCLWRWGLANVGNGLLHVLLNLNGDVMSALLWFKPLVRFLFELLHRVLHVVHDVCNLARDLGDRLRNLVLVLLEDFVSRGLGCECGVRIVKRFESPNYRVNYRIERRVQPAERVVSHRGKFQWHPGQLEA